MPLALLLSFLRNLAANNHKPWMDDHRADYRQARTAFHDLISTVLQGVQSFEPDLQGLSVKDTLFRINKNDRFQQSAEPYKRHMGAGLKRDGRHSPWAGYFLAIQPGGESWVGAGKWQPEPAALARIRQEIHYNGEAFHRIRQEAALVHHFPAGLEGERLQRPPKGYDKLDPDLEWLKLKSYTVSRNFTDAEVLQPDFAAQAIAALRTAQPLVAFLNQAIAEEPAA